MRFESTDWSLEVADGWIGEADESCTTFYHPQGAGAFQLSSYRKDDPVTDDDLRDFAEETPLTEVAVGRLTGFHCQFSKDDNYWMHWWLRAGRQMIYATYNCPLSERGGEDEAVSAMLRSLVPEYDQRQAQRNDPDADSVRCSVCGEVHSRSEIEVTFKLPDPLLEIGEEEWDTRCVETSDLCSLDDRRFFVRGVLPIPVHGRDVAYSWGVWAEVDEESFQRIVDLWPDEDQAAEPPMRGTLANDIPLFGTTAGLPLQVFLTGPETRPRFQLDESPHPLRREQQDGIDEHRAAEYNRLLEN